MTLLQGEKVIYEMKPNARILLKWFFTKCLVFGIVCGLISFLTTDFLYQLFAAEQETNPMRPLLLDLRADTLVGALCLIPALIYCAVLRKTHRYWITDQRCVFRGGLIRNVERSVSFQKITAVERSQDIFDRLARVYGISIFTPGTTKSFQISTFGIQQPIIRFEGLPDNSVPATLISRAILCRQESPLKSS